MPRFIPLALCCTALTLAPIAALAEGGNAGPAPAPVLIAEPAPITDWSGGYAGVSAGQWTGEYSPVTTFTTPLVDITAVGLFGGYLFQSGSLVYGAEIAYTPFEQDIDFGPFVIGDNQIVDMLDVSARAGFVTGDVQLYGLAGLSRSTLEILTPGGLTITEMTGYHVGLGADYRVSERFSVGATYVHRQFEDIDYNPQFNDPIEEITSQSLSLRASFHF